MIVILPFPGFYDSIYSQAIDFVEEREAEYMAEHEASLDYYPETFQPEHLRLDSSDYAEIFFDCTDYQQAYRRVAECYVQAFDFIMHQDADTPLNSFVFESMDSPREYNFATDRVYATVPDAVIESLFASVDRERLAQVIRDRFTSRDGFSSFYSPDIEDWDKPLSDWDHNELGTLLIAAIGDADDDKLRWRLHELTFDGDEDYQAWSDAVDWRKVDEKVSDKRAEKLESEDDTVPL